jgi:hypothetical protein
MLEFAVALRNGISLGPLCAHHDGIAVTIDHHFEFDRPATHGTILDEPLAGSTGGIDADVVRFGATRARVSGVGLEGHERSFGTFDACLSAFFAGVR